MNKVHAALVSLIFLGLVRAAFSQSPAPQSVASQPVSPMVQMLSKQADERKVFFEEQSKEKNTMRLRFSKELRELLATHREARRKFAEETHSGEERKSFFMGLRKEMHDLKQRQQLERQELKKKLKAASRSFHASQKQEQTMIMPQSDSNQKN